MSPELLLGLAAVLAAVALIINVSAKRTGSDGALIASLINRVDTLSGTVQSALIAQNASAVREVELAKEKTDATNQLAAVQDKLDMALAELAILKAQLKTANEQITRLLELQAGTTPQENATNVRNDAASAVTAVPPTDPEPPASPAPVPLPVDDLSRAA